MNDFDQAARYTAKIDPPGFFRWLYGEAASAPLAFRRWCDTRTLPFPGEPDRTCDTVAEFEDTSGPDRSLIAVAEFQSRPAGDPRGPEDLAATIYHLLGINPDDEFHTPEGRPVRIVNNGRVIRELL